MSEESFSALFHLLLLLFRVSAAVPVKRPHNLRYTLECVRWPSHCLHDGWWRAGTLESTYALFVTLRSPFTCVIRDGAQQPRRIALAGTAVATAVAAATFYAAVPTGEGGVLELFDTASAARRTTVTLPAAPVTAAALPHAAMVLVAVALRDCAVVVYNGATPVSRHMTSDVVLGMHGGACPHAYSYAQRPPNSTCRCWCAVETVLRGSTTVRDVCHVRSNARAHPSLPRLPMQWLV